MSWSRWLRRHLWARPGRTAISIVAVVTGVGVFVGVALGTQAVVDEIRTSQSGLEGDRFVGLEPVGFADEIDRADLEVIEALPGVRGVAEPLGGDGDEPDTTVQVIGDGFGIAPFTVFLEEGVDADAWKRTYGGDLGPLRIAEFDTVRNDSIEFFESIESALVPLSAASLVVSGFIIYVTMNRTVGDRRITFGTMRAMGARPSTVVRSVLAESVVIGAIGTVLGIGLGHVLGPAIGRAMSSGFGIPVSSTVTTIGPLDLALACVGGLVVPPVAAGIPAWRAARVQPATAMRTQRDDTSVPLWRGAAGIAAFAAGTGAAFVLPSDLKAIGAFVAMVGLFAGVPLVVSPLAGAIRSVLLRTRPGIADIAVAQVVRRRGRTAVTIGLVTGTLALVWTSGTDGDDAISALRAGGATVVSTNVAETAGVSTGDTLTVRGVAGDVDLVVAGTYYGFAYGTADAVMVSIDDGRALFRAANPDSYLIDVDAAFVSMLDDQGLAAVDVLGLPDLDDWFAVGSTTSDYGFAYGVFPLQSLRTQIVEQFDGIFGLVQVLALMVAALGLLGLTNTLAMEVLDRRQEFGVLRALGLQRREVIRLVVVEGALLAVIAALLAAGAGTVLGWAMADSGAGSIDQLDIPQRFPGAALTGLLAASILVGSVMSILPGRAAARVSPTELLRAGD